MSTSSLLFFSSHNSLASSQENLSITSSSDQTHTKNTSPVFIPNNPHSNVPPASYVNHSFFTVFGFHQNLDPTIKIIMICAAVLEMIPLLGAFFTLFSTSIKTFGDPEKTEKNLKDPSYTSFFYVRITLSLLGLGVFCLLIDLICTIIVCVTKNITKQ